MATVYRARDLHSGEIVALKVMHEAQAPSSGERFDQEAALLSELVHPAIVRHIDHGITPQGERYLAMEWLEGETLEDRLARGPIDVLGTAQFARRVLEGLAAAHRRGIIHRDLKPANLYLPRGEVGQVKILDFGVARRVQDGRRMTMVGSTVGTPMYMSPEQARGLQDIDVRADVFSLGSVLFECLTGDPPFMGDTPVAVLAKILLDDSVNVRERCPSVPSPMAVLLTHMLTKDRNRRPADAAVLAEQFSQLIDNLMVLGFGRRTKTGPGTPTPMVVSSEQRVLSAIMVTRPQGPDLRTVVTDRHDTWDAPSGARPGEQVFDDELFAQVEKMVGAFGARADRMLGGSIVITMIGRGTPTDQAVQAARCALKLKSLIPWASFAVSTGRAVMGTDLPIGQVIDAAARLVAQESSGAIVIDELTASLIEARFETKGLTGKRRLLFEKGLTDAPRTLLGREIPCVGRDRELASLQAMFDECVNEPVARAVLVTAPAGGGKSRVRHELLERIQNRGDQFEYLVGRGDSLRAGAPFALLAPAMRSAAGITGAESIEVQRKRLQAHVGQSLRGEQAQRAVVFLGEMVGVPFPDDDLPALRAARHDPRLMADQMLAAWLGWLEAVCAVRPVVLILEDLQWGDVPSVQFVDAALRTLRDRPFLVAAFGRPEVDEKFAGLWEERDVQRISLAPLGQKACEKLMRHVLGDTRAETAAWVIDRADGNPFFLEELLRAVAEGGDAVGEASVPPTVLGMVQARFDTLGAQAKKILRIASIFGQTFRPAGVLALLGEDERTIAEWLDVLTTREVVFPRALGDEREFVFRHALLRDAAYDMLTSDDRRLGHRLAGEWLEGAGEREAIVLVEHFERGGILPRAAHWCRFAAAQALDANDLAAAIERAQRGVRDGAEGETLGLLRVTEAQARFWRGEYADAEWASRKALETVKGVARYHAMNELIAALGQQARYDEVEGWLEELERPDASPDARDARLACALRAAGYLLPGGRFEITERLVESVERQAGSLPTSLEARAGILRAHLALVTGHQAVAVEGFRGALAVFEAAGDLRMTTEAFLNLGMALGDLGVLEEADRFLSQALVNAERMGLSSVVACVLVNLTMLRTNLGAVEDARALGDRARLLAREQGDPRLEGAALVYLSTCEHVAGDHATSLDHARASLEVFQQVLPLLPAAMAAVGRALLASGRVADALEHAEEANALLESAGRVEDCEALIRLVLIEARVASGDGVGAQRAALRAVERLQERAASIETPAWRETFLRRLPDHAATLAWAAKLRVSTG